MRKIKKKENKFDKLLDIPKEITTNIPKIIINGFEEILIENYNPSSRSSCAKFLSCLSSDFLICTMHV